MWKTRIAQHVSGREVRVSLWQAPLYEFELSYDALSSSDDRQNIAPHSQQMLMDFFHQARGQGGNFLYQDPSDCVVVGQALGAGDGATVAFPMVRTLLQYTERVGWVTSVSAVYVNSVSLDGSQWNVTFPNTVTLTSAPAAGAAVTADFSFAYVCRFLDDQMDMEEFMNALWQMKSLKFRSVRQ